MPRYFGLTPPVLLFGLATAALAIAIALAILERWIGALVFAVASLAFLALFVGVARRKPDTALTRKSVRAIERVRERTSWAIEAVAIRSSAGREVTRLRYDLAEAEQRREALLRDLGAAVYENDDAARETLSREIAELDEEATRREAEMNAIADAAQERIEQGRLRVQPTMIEPPEPLPPEPSPPPDEGTPPTPPTVPEPYPPPDEGTPPAPSPVPEPEPGPEPEIRAK